MTDPSEHDTGTPIRVEDLSKRFGSFEAVRDVTFTAEGGSIIKIQMERLIDFAKDDDRNGTQFGGRRKSGLSAADCGSRGERALNNEIAARNWSAGMPALPGKLAERGARERFHWKIKSKLKISIKIRERR